MSKADSRTVAQRWADVVTERAAEILSKLTRLQETPDKQNEEAPGLRDAIQ